jgi:drug/metabolite transporter (DMT)-like permease
MKPAQDLRSGLLFMLAGSALFAVMNMFAKIAADHGVHFGQIMFFRNFAALLPVGFVVMRAGGLPVLRTPQPHRHAIRAATQLASMGAGFIGLALLPLAESNAINYAAPIFVAILAVPFLGERPGLWRWLAVLLGFVGVLAIAAGRGGFGTGEMPLLGVAMALANAAFSATVTIQVRQMAAIDSPETIVAWQSLLMTAVTACFLPFVWATPSPWILLCLIAVGLCGGMAQYCTTQSYARAEASAVGPYGYSGIVFGAAFGWLVWGDAPTAGMLLGGMLVAGSGLLILRANHRR